MATYCFNPRPREEGDTEYILQHRPVGVSIHALAKRATGIPRIVADYLLFQSTPSRRGRHAILTAERRDCVVSIHALAKRATTVHPATLTPTQVSIHALAKRATPEYASPIRPAVVSIHALAKRATSDFHAIAVDGDVSIHALAKRATRQGRHIKGYRTVSIHALAKRATLFPPSCGIKKMFQSTPSRRGRRWVVCCW